MTMRVDQSGQQRLLAKVDSFTGVARFDLIKFPDIGDSIPGNSYRAVVDWRSIHRNNCARMKNHSLFTTFRHSATSRLHASWQSSGIVAAVAAAARVANPGPLAV